MLDFGQRRWGPARLLSRQLGAEVTGVDANAARCRDAEALTKLTNVDRVEFLHDDFLKLRVRRGAFDVLWEESAWNHIADEKLFLERWLPSLRNAGRIACEDVFFSIISSCTARQRRLLEELRLIWRVHLLRKSTWVAIVSDLGLKVQVFQDLSTEMEMLLS